MSDVDQIFLNKPYTRIYPIKKEYVEEKAVRIYRESPTHIQLQIRSYTDKRGMLATTSITKAEALEIAAYLTRKAAELRD